MATKEEYCFRVLRKYGLLVDFDGEVSRVNVPEALDGNDETLNQWIQRVLGPKVSNVVVYLPDSPKGNRKIEKLKTAVNALHLQGLLRAQAKVKNAQAEAKTGKAVEETEHLLSTFSKETIQDLLAEIGDSLEPSVRTFFERQIDSSPDDIPAEKLLRNLIKSYNDVAYEFRKLSGL
jgi:hypothetical protein